MLIQLFGFFVIMSRKTHASSLNSNHNVWQISNSSPHMPTWSKHSKRILFHFSRFQHFMEVKRLNPILLSTSVSLFLFKIMTSSLFDVPSNTHNYVVVNLPLSISCVSVYTYTHKKIYEFFRIQWLKITGQDGFTRKST